MKLRAVSNGLSAMPVRLGIAVGDDKAANQMRRVLEPWRRWYQISAWHDLRIATFVRDGWRCKFCGKVEVRSRFLVGDHIVPHKGDRVRFFDPANLQTLCKPCHDSEKQKQERSAAYR